MRLRWSPELTRFAGMLAVFVTSGLAITFLLLPPPPEPPKAEKRPPVLRVAGVEVPSKGDPVSNAMDLVRRYAATELAITLPDGSSRKLKKGALGAEIDRVRLASFVREAMTPGSAIRREHEKRKGEGPLDVPVPITIDTSIAMAKLLDIKATLDRNAVDAFVDLAAKKLRPEKVGHRLDVYGTLANIDAALRAGKNTAPAAVETIAPQLSATQLGNVKFDQVLGYFETRYTQGAKNKERTYNLRLAASKLDGTVVMPGAVFDFNATVGPRDEAHGYRVAPVIAQGELVDGLGGGTCQISGTLHGAAFFAGLEIVERYPHSRPSYYIKLGLDATVVYPTINYRFRNPYDFPIVLHETVSGGVVRAEILGPSRKHTVTYFRRIDEVLPFDEVERPSAKLPEGTRILAQRGIPGFKTYSSRVVRDGAYALRQHWRDTYPPTTQIVHVGTGSPDLPTKAQDDSHPEYVVDEYLVVTQGPDIRTPGAPGPEPGGGTVESREPGKTGEQGWTERAGFSAFKSKGETAKTDEVASKDDRDAPPKEERKKRKKKKKKASEGT
jgi:vancomycin resistance protein YoaR